MILHSVDANSDVTLLEVMEHKSIPIQAHCREGFCGACRTRLISGEVEYSIEPLAYIEDDEVLPCCCKPKTPLELTTN